MTGLGVANMAGMPVMRPDMSGNPKAMLNTCIHNYLVSEGRHNVAKALLESGMDINHDNIKRDTKPQVNGIDPSADPDSKDDNKNRGADTDNFLLDYWFIFFDMWNASKNRGGENLQIAHYMQHQQQRQRMAAQQAMMPNGVMNGMNGRFPPNQMGNNVQRAALANHMQNAQGQRRANAGQMQREGSGLDLNGENRAQSPASGGENAPSPKRQRVDGSFNGQQLRGPSGSMAGQLPNGAPGNQAAMLMQRGGMDPSQNSQPQLQYQQQMRAAMQNQMSGVNGSNGLFNSTGSPMMAGDGVSFPMDGMNGAGMRGNSSNGNNNGGALADYQMQLMLLEQQNKKRLMMARQEQDINTGPMAPSNFAPGTSPNGRQGQSPPMNEMKRPSPKMGQGSPLPDGSMPPNRHSPIPGFDAGHMNPAMNPQFIPQMNKMMGEGMMQPNGMMRGPGPHQNAQMEMMRRNGQMPNGNYGPPMNGQMMQPGGQQNAADPNRQQQQQQGSMLPPSAPATGNKAPTSPTQNAAPPTPSQKKEPKSKKETKESKKKAPKSKGSTTSATPNPENEKQSTPPPQTPITPVAPDSHIIKGPNNQQSQTQAQQQPSQPGGPIQGPPNGQQGQANPMQQQPTDAVPFGTFGDNNDFSGMGGLDNFDLMGELTGEHDGMQDVVQAFDFDSFLNTNDSMWDPGFDIGEGLETGAHQ